MQKIIKQSDYRLPYVYQWGIHTAEFQLLHLTEQETGRQWMLIPMHTRVAAQNEESVDVAKINELISDETAYLLLSCGIVEYAEAIKRLSEQQEAVEFFTMLRNRAIECLEKFFPQSGEALANLRLANVQSEVYGKLFERTMLFRAWLAGRYLQLLLDTVVQTNEMNEGEDEVSAD